MRGGQLALAIALALPAVATAGDDEPIKTLLEFDEIPAINDPAFVTREDAEKTMRGDELVIGLIGTDGVARAYSTVALDHHEIVNDTAGEVPVAVTW